MEIKDRKYSHEKDLISQKPEIKAFLLIFIVFLLLVGGLLFKVFFLNSTIESNNKIISKIPSIKEQLNKIELEKPILQRKLSKLKKSMQSEINNAIASEHSKLHLTQYMGILESSGVNCSNFSVEDPQGFMYGDTSITELNQTIVKFDCKGDYASYLKAQNEINILGDNVNLISQKIDKLEDGISVSGVFVFIERK